MRIVLLKSVILAAKVGTKLLQGHVDDLGWLHESGWAADEEARVIRVGGSREIA